MRKTAVKLKSVGVSFSMGRGVGSRVHWALQDVSLDLCHGDKLGVLGRNGAGKSTLLRVLSGAISPDRGHITRDHGRVQLLSLNLGFAPHLSGRDNAVLSGLLQGFDRPSINARLPLIREFSELGEFFDRPINTYSSGMVARLGFSLAMQLEPDILLLDETLSVGDAEFRRKSNDALRERFGGSHTVVLVSHNEKTVTELCTRLLWVENGVSVMHGRTDEVLRAYREAYGHRKKERLS